MNEFRMRVSTVSSSLVRASFLRALGAMGLALAMIAGSVVGSHSANAADVVAPDELIKSLSAKVLDQIKNDKEIQAGNMKRLSDFVDTTIMPNVNFERMTSLSVGRGWRSATAEQKSKLIAEFRTLLIRTYSGALTEFKEQTVRVKPLRAGTSDDEVIVRSEVVPKRGEAIQLDYRMEKSADGWKIYDVNVASLWLVETYRNQFSEIFNAKGVDGLIASLVDKNRKFESSDKK